jgi:hypothetical protein
MRFVDVEEVDDEVEDTGMGCIEILIAYIISLGRPVDGFIWLGIEFLYKYKLGPFSDEG